jgi:predicted CopG family antitoxin
MNDRTTITIDKKVYQKLREKGRFGETYTQLISRLIDLAETKIYDRGKLKVA